MAAGAVLGWLWATRPEAWLQINGLEVLTAIGTVGAVWAAVWATGRAEHLREVEAAERISRASASFAIRCTGISNLLKSNLDTADRMQAGPYYPDAYRIVTEAVEDAVAALQAERAAAIAFLPEGCSQRVETAIELLRSAQGNLRLAEPAVAGLNEAGIRAVIKNVLIWGRPAVALLLTAGRECVKVSPGYIEHWPKGLKLIKLGPEHHR